MINLILAALISVNGTSMDEIALSVHASATRYTRLLHTELCGEFIQNADNSYTLSLTPSVDREQCTIKRSEGGTGIIFHTHPVDAPASFAEADYALPGYLSHGRKGVFFQNGRGTERKVSTP